MKREGTGREENLFHMLAALDSGPNGKRPRFQR